jgi:hypothetical protein
LIKVNSRKRSPELLSPELSLHHIPIGFGT